MSEEAGGGDAASDGGDAAAEAGPTAADRAREEDASAAPPLADVDVEAAREELIAWYEADHRGFPWRETDDAYESPSIEVLAEELAALSAVDVDPSDVR